MSHLLFGLPAWLVVGLAVGAAFAVLAAGAFAVGPRLFPAPAVDRDGRFSAEDRRRAEIRGYLRGLGEEFAEDHPVGGQVVAFYLPQRDVAITFDARAYFRIEGTGTHPVLVEHELPGAALGPRLPFETPAPPGQSDDADPTSRWSVGAAPSSSEARPPRRSADAHVSAAFDALGLPTTADVDAVKAAYREKMKTVHPDQGGDPEEFRRVREAYTVAKEAAS